MESGSFEGFIRSGVHADATLVRRRENSRPSVGQVYATSRLNPCVANSAEKAGMLKPAPIGHVIEFSLRATFSFDPTRGLSVTF
jgi:hypothetical protein